MKINRSALKALIGYIKSNPESKYSDYMEDVTGTHLSDATFYKYRLLNNTGYTNRAQKPRKSAKTDKRPYHRSPYRNPLYLTLWSCPTENLNTSPRDVLTDLVNCLNNTRHTRWQLIELKNPEVIELRETSKR